MSPSAITSDSISSANSSAQPPTRTLLLSPPSLSSHPEKLNAIIRSYDRSTTDLQMLDRLALGIVSLPTSVYDVIVILTDADGSRSESMRLVNRQTLTNIVRALKPGGRLRSEDGLFGTCEGPEQTEAILAGLVNDGKNGLVKPDYGEQHLVPLRLGKKKTNGNDEGIANGNARDPMAQTTSALSSKPGGVVEAKALSTGVGFVDFTDDFGASGTANSDECSDGELIDEDTLLGEEDMNRPIIQRESMSSRILTSREAPCSLFPNFRCPGVSSYIIIAPPLANDWLQPLNAVQRQENDDGLAKTAPVVWHRDSKQTMQPSVQMQTKHLML